MILPGHVSGRALLIFLGAVAVAPWALPNNYLVQVLAFAGLNAAMATALNLLMGYAGQVSLGHAGFYGLGAYVSGVLGVKLGMSPWLGLPLAAVTTGALAYVVGIPTLRPAAGLNATEKVEMIALISRLRDRGIAILIIEHDMRLVMRVSDRVVVLHHGEKIAEGTPGRGPDRRRRGARVPRRGRRAPCLRCRP